MTGRSYVSDYFGDPPEDFIIYDEMEDAMTNMPDVTYYHGQAVDAVTEEGDGWAIVLESGVRIVNLDEEYEMPEPDTLVGKAFMLTTLDSGLTRLYFGTDDNPHGTQVNLDPLKYGISDPTFNEGRIVRPQHPEDEAEFADVTPEFEPSAPGERVAEGPVTPDEEAEVVIAPQTHVDDEEVEPS